jgi:hypothetical protein
MRSETARYLSCLPSEGKGHTFESCRVRQGFTKIIKMLWIFTRGTVRSVRGPGPHMVRTLVFRGWALPYDWEW